MDATSPSAREKLVALNKEIALCANRKDLTEATALFKKAKENGWCNSHTYSGIINTNIRCGNINNAISLFEELKCSKQKGLRIDVITCTTIMKGYTSIGDIKSCLELVKHMMNQNPKVLPNIRTINTILRGCVFTGNIEQADKMILNMNKYYKVVPDVSSWEYYVTLLCQGLKLDKVYPILGRLKNDNSMIFGLGAMYLALARALSLIGDIKGCKKALKSVNETLLKEEELEKVDDKSQDNIDGVDDDVTMKSKVVSGGKRAWKSNHSMEDNKRSQSLELFREHKRAEMRSEIDNINKFIENLNEKSLGINILLPYYLKVLSIPPSLAAVTTVANATSSDFVKSNFIKNLVSGVKDKFGLAYSLILKRDEPSNNILNLLEEMLGNSIDDEGHIDINKIFGNNNSNKLEICSGGGEWAVNQASNDKESNWITLELRHDRVYQTFTRSIYSGLNNLLVLGGDAMDIIPNHMPSQSIDNIFINHPEPPQQIGGVDSEGKHLLTNNFFEETTRIMKINGLITIVTDNSWYAKFLMRQLSSVIRSIGLTSVNLQRNKSNKNDKNNTEWEIYDSDETINVYVGKPGTECGHVIDASSYFDRLWKRGKIVDRYFILLKKTTHATTGKVNAVLNKAVPSSSSNSEPTESTSKMSMKRNKKLLEGIIDIDTKQQNKKIKFDDV